MDRKLLDYLPPVLREVLEFQAVNAANEPEIALAWDALSRVLANQFLEEADAQGVAIWERELQIYPKDTESLAGRKARIKALWNLELPYTFPWLKSWLTGLCGPDGHTETITDYSIRIQLDHNALPDANGLALEIMRMLLVIRPANMQILLDAFLQSQGGAAFGAASEMTQELEVFPWNPLLESQGYVVLAEAVEYGGAVEIFPAKEVEVCRIDSLKTMAQSLPMQELLFSRPVS